VSFFRVRSLIAKDVPPYTIVWGVPAEEIKKHFSEDVIVRLMEMQWWNWDSEKVKNDLA
jgi:virginiamycin A acetyltransferase